MSLRYLVLTGLFVVSLPLLWLWLTLLSPWTYQQPEGLPAMPESQQQVFVYGTLTHAPVRWLVYGRTGNPVAAQLAGFERQGLDLAPNAHAQVNGLLLNVNVNELRRLDRYERLGVRYERVRVRLSEGQQAWVYQRLNASPAPVD
ncbi:gamma-glutamylcyclotransferase family protein [Halomonas halocynthiae]|uniref:gamma-glutamylcyclotransferase family protein n=1 Tax=Halomonas halocynthiae TaxID=176290 RepID=UPI0004113E03|nr:gamma-glutamylcyclotransferase family protein [Halomonas halocynthiae]